MALAGKSHTRHLTLVSMATSEDELELAWVCKDAQGEAPIDA